MVFCPEPPSSSGDGSFLKVYLGGTRCWSVSLLGMFFFFSFPDFPTSLNTAGLNHCLHSMQSLSLCPAQSLARASYPCLQQNQVEFCNFLQMPCSIHPRSCYFYRKCLNFIYLKSRGWGDGPVSKGFLCKNQHLISDPTKTSGTMGRSCNTSTGRWSQEHPGYLLAGLFSHPGSSSASRRAHLTKTGSTEEDTGWLY